VRPIETAVRRVEGQLLPETKMRRAEAEEQPPLPETEVRPGEAEEQPVEATPGRRLSPMG
jgi:hypothetical protein